MADYIDDDELDLEDPTKKKVQPQPTPPVGRPVGPPAPGATPGSLSTATPSTGSVGRPINTNPTPPPAGPAPELTGTPAPAGLTPGASTVAPAPAMPVGSPISPNVPAPRPAGHHLEALAAQGPPEYHGIKRLLDTLGGATVVGRAVERGGGLGTLGYEQKLANAGTAAKAEEGQIEAGQKERLSNAQVTAAGTLAPLRAAQTEDIAGRNPTKLAVAETNQAGANERNQNTVQGAADRQATQIAATKPLMEARERLANAQADLAKFRADPNSPMYHTAQQHLELAQQNLALRLKEFEYNYDPSGGGMAPPLTGTETAMLPQDQQGAPIPLKSPNAPTAQTRSRGQMAAVTRADFPQIYQEIDKLAAKIGPGAGRWNEFWVNKAGMNDPDFAHLDTTLGATASGLAITHFGARGGGQQFIQQMKKELGEAQSPEDLKARLLAWDEKMAQYAKAAGVSGHGGGQGAPRQGTPKYPDGAQPGTKGGKHGYMLNGVFHADR